MKLTKLIFAYWKHWMSLPNDTILWALDDESEGIGWCDGYWVSFWYVLNYNFYKMNNKMYAHTGCKEEFIEPNDFDDDFEDL